ncbi:hypothetical protein T552_03116 [Pneumocystis carinii B80]|uniref:Uncharacterized protein n=1 Tax=Pneumocystis carinii (strain B80) TaxID=1408658 RepID=A0A0W4ZC08_PNEC8|nr:hypothetical protein T552_03116 [Pneumocystis carinii B80]KTW25843.1 hypothetical protein T552_03116 [Pneumocystis carinii B80]
MASLFSMPPNKKAFSILLVGVGSAAAVYYYMYHYNNVNVPQGKLEQLERKAENVYDNITSHIKDAYRTGKKQINNIEKKYDKVHNLIDRVDTKMDRIREYIEHK